MIGARFASIALTAFSRREATESFEFELTFKLNKAEKP